MKSRIQEFVMPSLLEGLSIAALEALGCGLPTVLTEVDGLRDFKTSYPNLIYCGISSEEIKNALQQVIEMSEDVRARLRQNNANVFPKKNRHSARCRELWFTL